jgi:hypothetical protein
VRKVVVDVAIVLIVVLGLVAIVHLIGLAGLLLFGADAQTISTVFIRIIYAAAGVGVSTIVGAIALEKEEPKDDELNES